MVTIAKIARIAKIAVVEKPMAFCLSLVKFNQSCLSALFVPLRLELHRWF